VALHDCQGGARVSPDIGKEAWENMRSERRRACVTVSIVLVVAVFMAAGHAVGGEGRGEEYFQNARRYFEGLGVPQSDTEAVKWTRKAAEQGDALGQNNLGVMYSAGRGVPQSDTEAVRWYRQAAEQGHAAAQDELRKRGLTWTVQIPEQQEVQHVESPTPPGPAVGKPRTLATKIPDELGDLD